METQKLSQIFGRVFVLSSFLEKETDRTTEERDAFLCRLVRRRRTGRRGERGGKGGCSVEVDRDDDVPALGLAGYAGFLQRVLGATIEDWLPDVLFLVRIPVDDLNNVRD